MFKYYIFFISVFFISCECNRSFLHDRIEFREYVAHETNDQKIEINIVPLEQTTNINGEIILSDYITVTGIDYTTKRGDSIHISAFYYHKKDSLPCELINVNEDVDLDAIYEARDNGMYDIPTEHKDYKFQKKETLRFVARSVLPKEMKKWIKFEQCRSISIKLHYPDGSSNLFEYKLEKKKK